MYRLIAAGCVLALGLLVPTLRAQEKAAQPRRPKAQPRHPAARGISQPHRTEQGRRDVIFLGDSITHGWEGQKTWQEHFGPFKLVNLGIGSDQTGHVL